MKEIIVLSRNLKEIRHLLGESQVDFAVHCGISIEILSLLERQKTDPKLSTLSKIAAYTGLTVSELLDSENPINFAAYFSNNFITAV